MTRESLRINPQRQVLLATYLFPIFPAVILIGQILLRPVNFLFADDWLLAEYLNTEDLFRSTSLLSLVNGHNVLFTKILLVTFEHIFGPHVLTFFAIFNVVIWYVTCTIIFRTFSKFYCVTSSFVAVCTVLFFNFKQAQNFNMIVSSHFLHSLFFIASYIAIESTSRRKWRWLILVIAPFTGGLGLVLLVLEALLGFKRFLLKYKKSDLIASIVAIFLFIPSYGLSFIFYDSKSNNPESQIFSNLMGALESPWLLPSYLISALGAPYVPLSRFSFYTSQVAGVIIVYGLWLMRSKLRLHSVLMQTLCVVLISIFFFAATGYDGSANSLGNAYSNRYVTSSMLTGIILVVGISELTKPRLRKILLILLLFTSLTSGLKAGIEWVAIRSSQSKILNDVCFSQQWRDRENCLKMSFELSFYSDKTMFRAELERFIELRRR